MVTIATGSKKIEVSMKSHVEESVMWGLITIVVMLSSQCLAADVCDPNPCKNEGTCSVGTGSLAECACTPGWGGDTCEDASCDKNPCQNGGTCAVVSSSIVCNCDTGFGGDRCQLAPKCTDATPCKNGGTCKADTSGRDICFCAPGFGGDLCADASGAAKISVQIWMLAVVAVLTKLSLN